MSPARRPGIFVVLEGIDGAGTTTQAEALTAALKARGHRVLTTCEPSDGPIGSLIRQALLGRLGLPGRKGPLSPETLALLFAADRVDHLEAQVLPALRRGEVVLCDCYLLSSLAYQGSSLPMAWVEQANARAVRPDLTLFIEVEAKTASRRRSLRGGEPEMFDADAKQRRIAKQYLAAIRRRSRKERIVRIDGSRNVDEVTRRSLQAIDRALPAWR